MIEQSFRRIIPEEFAESSIKHYESVNGAEKNYLQKIEKKTIKKKLAMND